MSTQKTITKTILVCDKLNKNGFFFPREVVQKALTNLDHTVHGYIGQRRGLKDITFIAENPRMTYEGNVIADLLILNNPNGDFLRNYINDSKLVFNLGGTCRMEDVKGLKLVNDFKLIDISADFDFNMTETPAPNIWETSKMYILVKDTIPVGHAVNSAAHASLELYLQYGNEPAMQAWLEHSFKKVSCKVTEEEFELAKRFDGIDHIVITEGNLGGTETAIAFVPRPADDWCGFFNRLPLYS